MMVKSAIVCYVAVMISTLLFRFFISLLRYGLPFFDVDSVDMEKDDQSIADDVYYCVEPSKNDE